MFVLIVRGVFSRRSPKSAPSIKTLHRLYKHVATRQGATMLPCDGWVNDVSVNKVQDFEYLCNNFISDPFLSTVATEIPFGKSVEDLPHSHLNLGLTIFGIVATAIILIVTACMMWRRTRR